jgi:hypothetical protein
MEPNWAESIYIRSSINFLHFVPQWFSPGTPASSTTKTGRHDIAEILLKVALNTINQSFNNHIRHLQDKNRAILVSDWLMLKKSSPLKLLGQMEPNLAGSLYVISSI